MNDKLKIAINVKNPNNFIKDLYHKKIELYYINQKDNTLELIIRKDDFELIQKIKTIKNLKIIEYYGKSKIFFFIKKNYVFILLFLLGIGLNILLSKMVLKVEINTSNKELKETIQQDLESLGIQKFQWKVSYQKKNEIKEKLLAKEKDKIEWLEIEERGTKYVIEVEEKKQKKNISCSSRNIISKKNAVITKIESSSGEIVKKKEDYVEKGEVIISGFIHNKEKIVSKKCAIGKVYGETWYKVVVESPIKVEKMQKTNKSTWGFKIKFLQKEWIFPRPYETYKKDEYNIIKSKILPIEVGIIKEYEVQKINKKYTFKEVEKKAIQKAIKTMKKKIGENGHILRKNVLKKTTKNSKIIIEVFFAIEEDITDYQDITKIDIEKINQETEE